MLELDKNVKTLAKGKTSPPLGILRNLPPPPFFGKLGCGCSSAGDLKEPTEAQAQLKAAQAQRKDRYKVLSGVRKMLLKEGSKRFPELPTKYHRSTLCKHALTGSEVAVLRSKQHGKAFFDGLQTCGNVWTCPVCAAKVQERRRLEIAKAMKYFYQIGDRQAVMVTFTFPHKNFMKLSDLLNKQTEGLKFLRKGKQWDKFKEKNCFEGLIRSLEVTYGVNGWHPHTHELWFVNSKVDEAKFVEDVKEKWKKSCIKSGLLDANDLNQLKAFEEYSVDIRFNCDTSDYLAKVDNKDNLKSYWGADRELAKATSKGKREGKGMHPFQLVVDNKYDLFIEYVDAIRGKAQLFWSRGLKSKVGIDDKTDEELAKEKEDNADIITMISKPEWFIIRKKEKRAEVLDVAENEPKNIRSFIFGIVEDNIKMNDPPTEGR
jgi:hypothetical protein